MDPGNLVKIVFIAHLLLVSLLFKSFPLHLGFSLNSSAWPWDLAPHCFPSLVSPGLLLTHMAASHGPICRVLSHSASWHRLCPLSRRFSPHSLHGCFSYVFWNPAYVSGPQGQTRFHPHSQSKLDPKRPVFFYTRHCMRLVTVYSWLGCFLTRLQAAWKQGLCTLCLLLYP